MPPAGRRSSWPGVWPRWRAARSPPFVVRRAAAAAARSRLPRRRRQPSEPRRLARPHRAGQSVGHLVRALPQGNAGARRAAKASSAGRDFEVVAVNIDTRDPASRAPGSRRSASTGSRYYADPTAKVFQDLEDRGPRGSACRPRSWSIRTAARSARLAGPAEWARASSSSALQASLTSGAAGENNDATWRISASGTGFSPR